MKLRITKEFISCFKGQLSSPKQGVLLGTQDKHGSSFVNTVKAIIPFTSNDQDLVTLLATYMNHKGLSVVGWLLVTDKETAYHKIAQAYFETFTSAVLKVIVANCASKSVAENHSNVHLIAEESAALIGSMVGLLVYCGIKNDQNIGDYISNGCFPFAYPISTGEVLGKLMSMDQINHDLPCDPLEYRILSEFQSGLGTDVTNQKVDVALLESLTQSSTGFMNKKFRSRRAAASASASTTFSDASATFSAEGALLTTFSGHDSIDDILTTAAYTPTSTAADGKTKVYLMADDELEIVFGHGSLFIQSTLHSNPSLFCEFDEDAVASIGPETIPAYLNLVTFKEDLLEKQFCKNSSNLRLYQEQCQELELLFSIYQITKEIAEASPDVLS